MFLPVMLENFLSTQPRTKHCSQILEIKQKQVFSIRGYFLQFSGENYQKKPFWVDSWALFFNYRHFTDFS